MEQLRLQANMVVVSPSQVLQPGQVVVRHGRILQVETPSSRPDIDLGHVALLPGLINSHTHLEFSNLTQPFPPGKAFPEWIGSVVQWRRQAESSLNAAELEQSRRAAIAAGLSEVFKTGTAYVADIVTPPWSSNWLDDCWQTATSTLMDSATSRIDIPDRMRLPLRQHLARTAFPRVFALKEVLGLQPERFQTMMTWASSDISVQRDRNAPVADDILDDIGLSPHAPYSLGWEQASQNALRAAVRGRTVAMHVAESPAEEEWVREGSGPFAELFQRLQIRPTASRLRFEDAIELLQLAERGLLIHGYYLDETRLARAASSGRLSVVYCPRTCEHFGHQPLDLNRLDQLNLPVVLGTDSRASNPDLSIWREMQAVRRLHPDLSASKALAMITTGAAQALGLQAQLGSLDPGMLASINVVELGSHVHTSDPLEALTSPDAVACPMPLILMV